METFTCESGKLVIPSLYGLRQKVLPLDDVKIGTWNVQRNNCTANHWTNICAALVCYHSSVNIEKMDWSEAQCKSFSTSRLLHLCDAKYYQNEKLIEDIHGQSTAHRWQNFYTNLTHNESGGGVFPFGLACTIHNGDEYQVEFITQKKQIVALRIKCMFDQFTPRCEQIELGTFACVSGNLLVQDPCYNSDEGPKISNAKTGTWCAVVEKYEYPFWGYRCARLWCYHHAHEDFSWQEQQDNFVGVDSGQAGIFDTKYFDDDKLAQQYEVEYPTCPDQPWYSLCCDRTVGEIGAGIIPYGVVSSSGLGDGSYSYYTNSVDGETVGVQIVFM